FHMNDISTHPDGEVVVSGLEDSITVYDISLSGEPSGGVMGYFLLHPDPGQSHYPVNLDMDLPEDVYMDYRVRQYEDSSSELYTEAVPWTSVSSSGTANIMVPVNPGAIRSGGRTVLELVYRTTHSGSFPVYTESTPNASRTTIRVISHEVNLSYETKTLLTYVYEDKEDYRFGFNGQEKDNEIKGIGNSLDFGERMHDTRLGRFLSVDPEAANAPGWSPYNAMWNNPLRFVDPDGRWAVDHIDVTKNDDGTYNVVGGQANSDKNIYVVDANGKRTGEVVGQMLTEYSFHDEKGNAVVGANINLNDQSG